MPKPKRSLEDVVGKETYAVWVDMLRELVPDGRTHRLSVVVAGMLQYALEVADSGVEEPSVAKSLIDSAETSDPDEIKSLLHDVVTRLFKDADVTYERTTKSGEHYSIADEVYDEFSRWFDYPWD
ncbi:MAG: hypothetical protein HYZ24_11300 [Chloroflexi bacterium]|nr:hypothetical protein [Chloroflexota bacterium]